MRPSPSLPRPPGSSSEPGPPPGIRGFPVLSCFQPRGGYGYDAPGPPPGAHSHLLVSLGSVTGDLPLSRHVRLGRLPKLSLADHISAACIFRHRYEPLGFRIPLRRDAPVDVLPDSTLSLPRLLPEDRRSPSGAARSGPGTYATACAVHLDIYMRIKGLGGSAAQPCP